MYRPQYWSYAADLGHIYIDIPSRTLIFVYAGRQYGPYPLGLGKPSTPTPQGNWKVAEKDPAPWWEVLGSRWIGLNIPYGSYGIHGTNADWSIGGYVSNGCIRMHNWDVEVIYPLVVIGTPVTISGAYPVTWEGQYWWQAVQEKNAARRKLRRA
ncbi:MAG: L,D-transpeptidase [Bacillota bacterium]|jgi:lipoprotein-anchoring transpeptidase ErfK/SrfK